jgi:hypothetical protein
VAATSSISLLDGSQSGTQLPRIAMQRIWTARKVDVACGPNFICFLMKEKHKKSHATLHLFLQLYKFLTNSFSRKDNF